MPLDKKIRELQEKREKILLGGGNRLLKNKKPWGRELHVNAL